MAKTATLNIRIDPETKKGAEELYGAFGITITDAVNMFLRQSLLEGGLPFKPKQPRPKQPRYNAETEAAFREVDEMLKSGNYKAYDSYAELEADILAEMEAEEVG